MCVCVCVCVCVLREKEGSALLYSICTLKKYLKFVLKFHMVKSPSHPFPFLLTFPEHAQTCTHTHMHMHTCVKSHKRKYKLVS